MPGPFDSRVPALSDYNVEPPQAPPHLVALLPAGGDEPHFTTLGHLYCLARARGLAATAIPTRFRRKFVTIVLFSAA